MRLYWLPLKDEDRVGLPGRLFLGIVNLPRTGCGGYGLRYGIVGVDVGGEALQRGEHDWRRCTMRWLATLMSLCDVVRENHSWSISVLPWIPIPKHANIQTSHLEPGYRLSWATRLCSGYWTVLSTGTIWSVERTQEGMWYVPRLDYGTDTFICLLGTSCPFFNCM